MRELAARAGLPLATAYRLVDQLGGHDFLRRDDGGRVRLGLGLGELASRSSTALDLREAAMPYMEDVQAVVGQHTQLGVLRHDDVLFIERLSGRDSVVNQARVAGRLPIHKSSSGVVVARGSGSVQSVLPALLTGARGIARAMGEQPGQALRIPIH